RVDDRHRDPVARARPLAHLLDGDPLRVVARVAGRPDVAAARAGVLEVGDPGAAARAGVDLDRLDRGRREGAVDRRPLGDRRRDPAVLLLARRGVLLVLLLAGGGRQRARLGLVDQLDPDALVTEPELVPLGQL